jgi:hypothetical protein
LARKPQTNPEPVNPDDPDLLWGANAIARVLGRSDVATLALLNKGAIPARKIGGRWVVPRARLIAFVHEGV